MVDVALTRAQLRPARVIVVIDALRATSTITTALAAGYAQVLCCDSHGRALRLRAAGRVVAGERSCVAPAGFDEGNSPAAFERRRADDVALATTNGTPLIAAAAALGKRVLLASLLNMSAVARAARSDDVLIACAGTAGRPALEDTYVAGLLVRQMGRIGSDNARMALAVADSFGDPLAALAASDAAANLRAAGLDDDIERCARLDVTDCVPQVSPLGAGLAVARAQAVTDRRFQRATDRSIAAYVSEQKLHLISMTRAGTVPPQ